nr:twin-arginine translocation signal domain-containing protein [Enterovibrio nigricans]
MLRKQKKLVSRYLRGDVGRRDFLKGMAALGATATATGTLLGTMSSQALAADFDWKKYQASQ